MNKQNRKRFHGHLEAIAYLNNHGLKITPESNPIKIKSGSIGLKLLGAVDYLVNRCGYSVVFLSQ